ncbi:MAG: ABC transporter permease subunit, partial [Aquabacterium sp.]
MSAAYWRRAMNTGAGAVRPRLPAATAPVAVAPDPYAQSDAPRWLKYLWRQLSARHVFVGLFVLLFPFFATPFFTFQVAGQALALGLIALSLTFLGGYGGMISLAQLTVGGVAGYAVSILGTSGAAGQATSLGWPWWVAVLFALAIAVVCATLIGWLSVRPEGIYTIMI